MCLRPPALGKCGFGGLACAPCDPTKADTCDAAGLCRCGGTNPCGNNQQCVGGQCVCNAASCPNGCCNSGVCTTPTTVSLCGKPGLACTSCNATLADSCLNGDCSCGSLGAVCASGQRCVSGTCVCDATSCPNGCCKGANQCLSPSNTSQCGLGGVACQTCGTGQTCPNGACVGAPTPDGGSGTGGGSGSGGGTGGSGGSGGGGLGLVDHLDVVQNTLVVDAGACVQFQIQAKDAMGAVVPYVGLGLSYGFQPEPRGVDAYQDALCTIPPGRFTAGMLTQNGYLVAPSFGRATVYPTVIPATNYTQGKALAVDSYATLTGFPSQLPYGVCTSIVLSANAGALDDTTLTRSVAGGAIGFSQGFNCAGTMSPVILAGTKSVNVKVRTLSGGTIRVAGNPNVLRFTDVPVTLIRADGGAACLGLGAACAGDSVCCTDDCDNVLGCR